MRAIIEVDIPDYQIGQEVSIYFKDTMMIKGIAQEPKTDVLDKIRAEIIKMQTYKLFEDAEKLVALDEVLQIIDKYKAESEE